MQNKKGFTLIELMIVVAIVAILAMVAVPMYQRYIERSRNTAAQTLLQQLSLAEVAVQTASSSAGGADDYLEVTGAGSNTEVESLMAFGFRPDPNVGFYVELPTADSGFVAFAAHRARNSQVFAYDNVAGGGVQPVTATANNYAGVAVPSTLYIFLLDDTATTATLSGTVRSFGVEDNTAGTAAVSDGAVS